MAISQDKVRTIITIPKDLKKKLDKGRRRKISLEV